MSVLGKRTRTNTDFVELKENHRCSASPPHKKAKVAGEEVVVEKIDAMELDEMKAMSALTELNTNATKQAPSFSMQAVRNEEFVTITDRDLDGKWTILYFYPHDFEATATENLKAFKWIHSKLETMNIQVIAISRESHFAHLAWIQNKQHGLGTDLGICIASDLSTKVSEQYGVETDGVSHKVIIVSPKKSILYVSESQGIIQPQSLLDRISSMNQGKAKEH